MDFVYIHKKGAYLRSGSKQLKEILTNNEQTIENETKHRPMRMRANKLNEKYFVIACEGVVTVFSCVYVFCYLKFSLSYHSMYCFVFKRLFFFQLLAISAT